MDNLNYALDTWNAKLSEIWALLTQEPDTFKGGGIWNVMLDINGALKAIGYGLLVLFFAVGVVKTCSGLAEMKRPELAFKLLLRFALAKAAVGYGLDLMLALFSIIQGMVSTVITQSGLSGVTGTALPQEIVDRINRVDFLNSIPLWIVTLLGGLFIIVLSFIMILTVYARMFKIYIFTAISPIPLSSFAGETTSNIGKNFTSGLTRSLLGRGNHRPGLRHFYCHGVLPAAGKPRRGGRHGGMELYHGSDFQFIGFSRRGQNERPNRQGIIGIVKKRWNYSSAFYQLSE